MSGGNGHPSWQDDFPMDQEAEDFAVRLRHFEITCHFNGLGYSVRAVEKDRDYNGYQFAAYSETSPYDALGRVRQKIERGLATRHLKGSPGDFTMTHDTLRGRIGWTDERGAVLIVDGQVVTMENLASILSGHEGWAVELRITDALE